ncbi:MAG: hypothetical protein ACYDBB_11650 [Armatimonadota bacterium]
MSNIYSDTSMLEDDEAPRRFPWRVLLVLLFLLATAIYSVLVLLPAVRQYRTELRDTYFGLSGVVAEEVEQLLIPGETPDPQDIVDPVTALFDMDTAPAFVRIWDQQSQLISEATRLDPERTHTGDMIVLGDLGVQAILPTAQRHLDDTKWLGMAGLMQQIETAEGTLRDDMTEAATRAATGKKDEKASRGSLYSRQETLLAMTEGLPRDFPHLNEAVAGMNDALDALRNEADDVLAYSRASRGADNAQSSVTLTFAQFRAVDAGMVALPKELASHAPLPDSWPARILPVVRGQRVLIPLLSPAANDELVAPSGIAEFVFYHYPADLISALGVKLVPPAALLLATLAVLIIRRRKPRMPSSPSVPEPVEAV